ncbi:MAG: response regulator [Desulfobacterales bacterium]|nr:response regulator [Desulfobacterales bacterium]
MVRNIFKNIWQPAVPAGYRLELDRLTVDINRERIQWLSGIIFLFGLMVLYSDFRLLNDKPAHIGYRFFLQMDMALLVSQILFFWIAQSRRLSHASFVIAAAIIAWCSLITVMEFIITGGISSLIIGSFIVATVFLLPGWYLLTIYVAGLAVFFLILAIFQPPPVRPLVDHPNLLSIVLFAWACSRIFYHSHARRFVIKKQLSETNQKLSAEIEERQRAETALQQVNTELESRVAERTKELQDTNRQLSDEIENRKRTEAEKDKLEGQLRQSQKMESIGTLAGGIAHDFNNILSPIIGYTEMAMESLAENDPTGHQLHEVLEAADRAKDLVQQILTFSRQTETQFKPLSPKSIIREALKLIRATLPAYIHIEENIQSEYSVIMGDPTHIHQVVMNLCTNAYHAIGKRGGLIEVGLERVPGKANAPSINSGAPSGAMVLLTVRDTGHGMDEETRQRIFDPYFTTKSLGDGTGMGLAVVHGIVKQSGGSISVSSEPGKGSEFVVRWPEFRHTAPKVERVDKTVPSPLPVLGKKERILVVDDEKPIVTMLAKTLERSGFRPQVFTDSRKALQAFLAAPETVQAVVTDQAMPGMTGIELAKALLMENPSLPIILCTGYSDVINRDTAKSMGIGSFLSKPVGRQDLTRLLRKLLDKTEPPHYIAS